MKLGDRNTSTSQTEKEQHQMKQPLKAVDALLQSVEKQFGKGAMMRLGDRKAERVPCISTGSPSLDEALGCGGYPKGRVVEVFGPESSGKTTLTLHAIAQCQAMGGVAAGLSALCADGTPARHHLRGAMVRGPARWSRGVMLGPLPVAAIDAARARHWAEIDGVGDQLARDLARHQPNGR